MHVKYTINLNSLIFIARVLSFLYHNTWNCAHKNFMRLIRTCTSGKFPNINTKKFIVTAVVSVPCVNENWFYVFYGFMILLLITETIVHVSTDIFHNTYRKKHRINFYHSPVARIAFITVNDLIKPFTVINASCAFEWHIELFRNFANLCLSL